MSPAASTRWCPTPEQVMILEEMYRGGVRTPNAAHIQQITAHLSLYGKIEGKNVFYWFQNHKARDRQKLRKRLLGNKHYYLQQQQQQQQMMFRHHVPLSVDHHIIHQQQHFLPFDTTHPPPCCGPTSVGFHHQLGHVTSPCFAAHQGRAEDTLSQMTSTYPWKMDDTTHAKFGLENEKPMRITNDNDWMIRGDHHHHHHHHDNHDDEVSNTRKPLKTLELFPIKDKTSLKD